MKKILIVEDEETQSKVAKTFVEESGRYHAEIREDVDSALEYLKKNTPDLILLDVIMPEKHGTELLKKLNETKKWTKIPVIVLTIVSPLSGIEEDIKEIKQDVEFLEKPYTKEELQKKIKKILE